MLLEIYRRGVIADIEREKPDALLPTMGGQTALNVALALSERGVEFERYEGMGQDELGVMRDQGPPIAWFKDPAGNVLSVIQQD